MVGTAASQNKTDTVSCAVLMPFERRPTVGKTLEMRCKIEAVFEHYAEQSEYYRCANIVQRHIMEDRSYWLTMKLLSKIIGPFEGMEPGKD